MKKLLVFELHHLGDAVLALPFLRAARQIYDLTICCRPSCAFFFRHLIAGSKIIEWEPPWSEERRGRWGWFFPNANDRKIRQSLAAVQADSTVCVWADTRVHQLMRDLAIPERIGLTMCRQNYYGSPLAWRRRRLRLGQLIEITWKILHRPLLTQPVVRRSYQQSHLEDWEDVAHPLQLKPDYTLPWLPQPLDSLPEPVEKYIREARTQGRPLWLVHAGARLAIKRWPLERFEEILRTSLSPAQVAAVIVEPPGEVFPQPQTGHSSTKLTLSQMLRLLFECDAVLCHDSVCAHLAAAVGKKVVPIFGSGNAAWFHPFQQRENVVESHVCPYRPCLERCQMPTPICIESITTSQVAEVIARIKTPSA
jgi:heptosyltransferase-2